MTRALATQVVRRTLGATLALVLAGAGLALVAPPSVAAAPNGQLCGPEGGTSNQLTVTGWVNQERTYDKAALDALPQTTVSDSYLSGSGSTQRNYTGVDLARLLELPTADSGIGTLLRPSAPAGPQTPTQRNDVTRYSVVVTGSDCFQAVYAMSEISPYFGGRPVVVATAEGDYAPGDTTPVTGSLGTAGFARISNPVDVRGSRRVSDIVEIRVLQAPAETTTPPAGSPACAGGESTSLDVTGFVTAPATYDKAALDALPQTTVADTYLTGSGSTSANYTGVELWRLLGLSATDGGIGTLIRPNGPGPQAPAAQRNDLTRYSVMVTGTDCFQALYSLAEISPFFGGNPVLVATAQGPYDPADTTTPVTGSLDTSGFARMSVPVDQRGSRRVSNIAEIRVLPTPTPTVSWPTPAPILADTPLGATQLNATASYAGATVPGTFTYDRPVGTRLAPGTYTLSGLFVPTQPSSVTIARGSTTLTVLPAPALSATTLTPAGADKVTAGELTTVRTTLTSAGRPLAGEDVRLFATAPGETTARLLATVVTDNAGGAAYATRLKRNTVLEWRFAARGPYAAATSAPSAVKVRARVGLRVVDASLRSSQTLLVRGRTRPAQPGARVVLWRKGDSGRTRLAVGTVTGKGRIRLAADPGGVGRHRIYLTVAGSETNAKGTSRTRTVVVGAIASRR